MPESPEVQALAEFLDDRLRGRELIAADLLEFRALKTRGRGLDTLIGRTATGARRYGKHVSLAFGGRSLVVSLGRHGWARWHDGSGAAEAEAEASGPPSLASLAFDDGGRLELTDAGGWVSLGLAVVDDPAEVPSIAKLGPDPADAGFDRADFDGALGGRRKQIKAILQEQESLAGIGNAYSDEILHAAGVSPVEHAASLSTDAVAALRAATVDTIRGAIDSRRGVPIDRLKAEKVAAMRVHGRAGEACPVCGDEIRDFRFASTTAEYCPTCQTGGVRLPV